MGNQFMNKKLSDILDLYKNIEKGNLDEIHNWLENNIHKYGAVYKFEEIVKKITAEELTARYFIDYLNKKYSKIYDI
jgi:carboxypeptidase Taq